MGSACLGDVSRCLWHGQGGIGEGWGPGTPLHMEASLTSAFLVLLRRWRASPDLVLFSGLKVGSGNLPQSLWHQPW